MRKAWNWLIPIIIIYLCINWIQWDMNTIKALIIGGIITLWMRKQLLK